MAGEPLQFLEAALGSSPCRPPCTMAVCSFKDSKRSNSNASPSLKGLPNRSNPHRITSLLITKSQWIHNLIMGILSYSQVLLTLKRKDYTGHIYQGKNLGVVLEFCLPQSSSKKGRVVRCCWGTKREREREKKKKSRDTENTKSFCPNTVTLVNSLLRKLKLKTCII